MKKKQRLYFIVLILLSLGAAVGISLYALKDNVSFFVTPHEITKREEGRRFRLGGLVKEGSLQSRSADLFVSFIVTDGIAELHAEYKGILPDLFREGQGVVATGSIDARGVFVATEILAKHDENYMPPELAKSLEKAAKEKK